MAEVRSDELLRRQTLDLLRFPLAVVVLSIHIWGVTAPQMGNIRFQFDNFPVFLAFNRLVDGFFRNQSVPIYFFIAGYVFFYGVEMNKDTYLRKLKNRVKTLLIPYFIWNTVELMMKILPFLLPIPFIQNLLPAGELHFSWKNVLDCYGYYGGQLIGVVLPQNSSPINAALWFLRDLMIVVLCAPLLYTLLRLIGKYLVFFLGVIWVGIFYFQAYISYAYIYISSAFFFFSWGAYMSIGRKDMLEEFGRYFKWSMWLYPVLACLYVVAAYFLPQLCGTIKQLNVIVGLLFAYNLAAWLLKTGRCRLHPFLASSAFFIYVSHTLVVSKLLRILMTLIQPVSEFRLFAIYILTTIISLGFLLGVFYLLRRYTPGFLKIIAGRK